MKLDLVTFGPDASATFALAASLREQGFASTVVTDPAALPDPTAGGAVVVGCAEHRSRVRAALGPGRPLLVAGPHLRRTLQALTATFEDDVLALDDGLVDLANQLVFRSSPPTRLLELEAKLLRWLAARPDVAVSRGTLLVEVWGHHAAMATRTVENTVRRLRVKIEVEPSKPVHLVTVRRAGYRFCPATPPTRARLPIPPHPMRHTAERTQLDALVADARCVNVLGPAGIGKTSLVRTWATTRSDTVFVDLADARDMASVEDRVSLALKVPSHSLDHYLSERPLILVLDKVEPATRAVRSCLSRWASARFVLASQVRLDHVDERVFELGIARVAR